MDCSNFFLFQQKLMIFFIDQCSFSVRSEWRHLERSINELERNKRVLLYPVTLVATIIHGEATRLVAQPTCTPEVVNDVAIK